MKSKKMSLANIQGKLSRTEMKNIMAGVLTPPDCNDNCENGCGSGYYCDDISCGMIVKKGCIKKEV